MTVFSRQVDAVVAALSWRRTVVVEQGRWRSRRTSWKPPHSDNVRNLRAVQKLEPVLLPVGPRTYSREENLAMLKLITPMGPFPHPDDLFRLEPAIATAEELATVSHEELYRRLDVRQEERAGFFG